jgi:pseudouridine kinase
MMLALADMALYDSLTPEFLATRQPQRAVGALTVADMNLPMDTLSSLLDDARRDAIPLVIVAVSQPKMARLPQQLHGLRLLILNQGELEVRIGQQIKTEAELLAACRQVQSQGAQDVIVTRGGTGVAYTTPDGIAHLEAPDAHIVDVTGAGDAFSAAVCWSLFHGSEDLLLACRRGLRLSAMTLECEETVCPYLSADILSEIHNFDSAPSAPQTFNALYQD